MFPKSIFVVRVVYSILCCILIMLKWLDLHHHASTEGGGEGGNTKLIRAKLKTKVSSK
jgi:hypothetical protein